MHVFSAIGRLAELVCSWAVVPALSSTKSEGRRTPPQKKKLLHTPSHAPSSLQQTCLEDKSVHFKIGFNKEDFSQRLLTSLFCCC